MRSWVGVPLVCFLLTPALLQADTTIDFEDLPSQYIYLGGGQNIGTYYAGVDLESNVTGLDLTGSTAFPPHSGSIVVWDPVDLSAEISFTNPQTLVGVWYTSLDPLTLEAFDNTDTSIGSVIGAANTDGTTGSSDFLSFSGANIESVTLTGIPGDYVFDDLTFSQATVTAVPEPSSVGTIAAIAMLILLFRRKRCRGDHGFPRAGIQAPQT